MSVRLDAERAALLKKLSVDVGCPPSDVIRRSLEAFAAERSQEAAVQKHASLATPSTPTCPQPRQTDAVASPRPPAVPAVPLSFPPTHDELVALYRACGALVWPERRRLFQRVLAAAEVAQEYRENPRDGELYGELLRLGRDFGQFN